MENRSICKEYQNGNVCYEMKFAIMVSLVTVLCACGVTAPSEKVLKNSTDKWVGHTVDELIVANGEPFNVYPLESGGRVFEYLKGGASDQTQIRKHIKNYAHKRHGITTSDSSQSCKILFNISASDIIESWSTEGEKCN